MSYVPLGYFMGLGAVPEGRADPAACERLVNAYKLYQSWSKQPGDNAKVEAAKWKAEWERLKAQRACREASPKSGDVPGATGVPRPAEGPGRIQLPTYTIPKRGAFGFESKLASLSDLFAPRTPQQQQQPAMAVGGVPTWLLWTGGVVIALGAASYFLKKRR